MRYRVDAIEQQSQLYAGRGGGSHLSQSKRKSHVVHVTQTISLINFVFPPFPRMREPQVYQHHATLSQTKKGGLLGVVVVSSL